MEEMKFSMGDEHRDRYILAAAASLPVDAKLRLIRSLIDGISEQEAHRILPTLLGRIKQWGTIPHESFEALMKARVSVALEMVLIARDPEYGDAWVYMTRRPDNDPHYAGLLHVPGSILRPDEGVIDVARRLRDKEFGFPLPVSLTFVDLHMNHDTRGSCLGIIYLGDVGELPKSRTNWHRVRDLDRSGVCVHHGMRRGVVDKAEALWRNGVVGDYVQLTP